MKSVFDLVEYESTFDKLTNREMITDGEKDEIVFAMVQSLKNEDEDLVALGLKFTDATESIENHMRRLKENKEKVKKYEDRFKRLMQEAMELAGVKTLKTGLGTISGRKSSSTQVISIHDIPSEFIKETIPEPKYSADKTAIKKAIQSGVEVPGAYIEEKINISIK